MKKGTKHTKETLLKLRAIRKEQGSPWRIGKLHSQETKERISALLSGRVLSDEIKEKISLKNTGRKFSLEHKKNISKGKTGVTFTEKHKSKISSSKKGTVSKLKGKLRPDISGVNSGRWIKDRSLVKGKQNRNNPEYKQWRQRVWLRDNFGCKIANQDCTGRIEAHHILGWSTHPELRYQTNNGITLCHAHHPRKRAEEKRLIPTFQELVIAKKHSHESH